MPDYAQLYDDFVNAYKLTEVAPEEVSVFLQKINNYFIAYNLKFASAIKKLNHVKKEFMSMVDDATGKPMTASKAEVMADATPEADAYYEFRVHVQNIEQTLQSLKMLQRAVQNEAGHAN